GRGRAIAAFRRAHTLILYRITALLKLPVETMGRDELKQALDHIGSITDEEADA
ncbi:arsenate reductase ArsC, partial [Rhodanobacter denitrificans]|nr:arsenate reductase ArsC [Rhodanobacter denitrificans]